MTINEAQDQIISEMAHLGDWLDKYAYLIRQGDEMPVASADTLRREENLVTDCQSRVWIRTEHEDGQLAIEADSDARITRGIIALLRRVFDRQPPREILNANLYMLDQTGLGKGLSPSRSNGLQSILGRILAEARQHIPAD